MGADIAVGPHFRRVPDPLPFQDAIIGLGARCFYREGLASCLLRLSGYSPYSAAVFIFMPTFAFARQDIIDEDHRFRFEPCGSNFSPMTETSVKSLI